MWRACRGRSARSRTDRRCHGREITTAAITTVILDDNPLIRCIRRPAAERAWIPSARRPYRSFRGDPVFCPVFGDVGLCKPPLAGIRGPRHRRRFQPRFNRLGCQWRGAPRRSIAFDFGRGPPARSSGPPVRQPPVTTTPCVPSFRHHHPAVDGWPPHVVQCVSPSAIHFRIKQVVTGQRFEVYAQWGINRRSPVLHRWLVHFRVVSPSRRPAVRLCASSGQSSAARSLP